MRTPHCRLYQQSMAVCLHPKASRDIAKDVSSLGLPLVDVVDEEGTLVVAPGPTAAVDGLVLSALLQGRTIVAPSW